MGDEAPADIIPEEPGTEAPTEAPAEAPAAAAPAGEPAAVPDVSGWRVKELKEAYQKQAEAEDDAAKAAAASGGA